MHAAAVIVQKICIMMIFCIFFFIFLKPPRRTAVLASQKFSSTVQTIDHVSDPSGEQRGERKSKCSTFCVTYARAYELTSWFLLSWFDNLEVAESHVLELQRSLLEVF